MSGLSSFVGWQTDGVGGWSGVSGENGIFLVLVGSGRTETERVGQKCSAGEPQGGE